ncbi:MAG: CBS domain-containing protein [Gammaproteobacteria bacterium]
MQQIQKPISEFLSDKPDLSIPADATVLEAVNKMAADHSECLLVIENDELVGIFTERDFLNRVVGARLIPAETSLRDVMTANPDTLRTGDGVSYAVERMATRGFRNIPIFDDDDPAAVLTVWDVMTHLSTVLAEVQENKTICLDEWTDIGGG